eukprot:7379167-Prymnesium_polylepis.1
MKIADTRYTKAAPPAYSVGDSSQACAPATREPLCPARCARSRAGPDRPAVRAADRPAVRARAPADLPLGVEASKDVAL